MAPGALRSPAGALRPAARSASRVCSVMTERVLPKGARLIPPEADRVFRGEIYEVYQWPQKMPDGSVETFEMLRRPDTVMARVDRRFNAS